MLKQLLIFSRGGLILWICKELGNALKGSPIETLIRSSLLEELSGAASYNYDAPGAAYTLKWTFHNDMGLVIVVVYQRILHLLYVDDFVAMVKREFQRFMIQSGHFTMTSMMSFSSSETSLPLHPTIK
ncbi:hypothetical protein Vadar_005589 [Vaccinium darrowii]|uniref:Uncharacterized protein n=1 Tax=Vaccinium darrowii TaxID=229202 RepID=A0ACB7XXL9_9ERIC|nr:hypothetical protein Vadar_005589 [Vaccinium darrowii]